MRKLILILLSPLAALYFWGLINFFRFYSNPPERFGDAVFVLISWTFAIYLVLFLRFVLIPWVKSLLTLTGISSNS